MESIESLVNIVRVVSPLAFVGCGILVYCIAKYQESKGSLFLSKIIKSL